MKTIISLARSRNARILLVGAMTFALSVCFAYWNATARAEGPSAHGPSASPASATAGTVGYVDAPVTENIVSNQLSLAGWAWDPVGIRAIEVRVDGATYFAKYGVPRPDVSNARPDLPGSGASGFTFDWDFKDLRVQRHEVVVVAINTNGVATTLGRRSLVPPAAMAMWSPQLDASPGLASDKFYFLMATSGTSLGGATGVEIQYDGLLSRTQRVGISVPILYMRTTTGAKGDWTFDPAFDLTRRCKNRRVADDNLDEVIQYSIAKHIPVNFILNGGIWGDASCYSAEWDLTTHLEVDPANCQWEQHDLVLPGDYKKGLNGSTESPELSRSLTYHVYNREIRDYKRRNLQAAARIVAKFAREHPDLFVGVNLDADTYMNPFPEEGRMYDYNPGMLRQFRAWLAGTGPYAGDTRGGLPDLRYYRRKDPLSLAAVNKLAGKHWTAWSQVDPPRTFEGNEFKPVASGKVPFWRDPWYQEWDVFRKHIVQLHYAELAEWTHEAGIPADKIFTAQAFTAQDEGLRPISTYVRDASQDADSAGVSIEGAVPRVGHLGTIVYGFAAQNKLDYLSSGHNLFATIARMDPHWAIVESNATDLKHPTLLPTYAQSYREFRDFFNYGGRQIALMAWNGSNGLNAGKPGYVAYTSWRNTPGEQAMMDFMVSHADVPQGSLMWTFGSSTYSDDDGWLAVRGHFVADHGALHFVPTSDRMTLRSPADQVIHPQDIGRMFMRFDGPAKLVYAVVSARADGDTKWRVVATAKTTDFALKWPEQWVRNHFIVNQLEMELFFAPGAAESNLSRVLLYPPQAAAVRTAVNH
jgi:hypothetical protein